MTLQIQFTKIQFTKIQFTEACDLNKKIIELFIKDSQITKQINDLTAVISKLRRIKHLVNYLN
jgi:hypothetical protein